MRTGEAGASTGAGRDDMPAGWHPRPPRAGAVPDVRPARGMRQSRHDAPRRPLRRPRHEPRRLLPLVGDPARPGAGPLRRAPGRRRRGPDDRASSPRPPATAPDPIADVVSRGVRQRPGRLRRRADPPRRDHRLDPPRRRSPRVPRRAVRLHRDGQPGLRRHGRAPPDGPDGDGAAAPLLPLDRAADAPGHRGLLRGGARRAPGPRDRARHAAPTSSTSTAAAAAGSWRWRADSRPPGWSASRPSPTRPPARCASSRRPGSRSRIHIEAREVARSPTSAPSTWPTSSTLSTRSPDPAAALAAAWRALRPGGRLLVLGWCLPSEPATTWRPCTGS